MADMPEMQIYLDNVLKAQQDYFMAVDRQAGLEGGHLQKLSIEEDNSAADDDMPIDEAEKADIMGKHKANSPFALDVAAARAKLIEVIKS